MHIQFKTTSQKEIVAPLDRIILEKNGIGVGTDIFYSVHAHGSDLSFRVDRKEYERIKTLLIFKSTTHIQELQECDPRYFEKGTET